MVPLTVGSDGELRLRILIVEDEARIRAFLARAFEAEGFSVDVVEDGEHGLERALDRQPTSS